MSCGYGDDRGKRAKISLVCVRADEFRWNMFHVFMRWMNELHAVVSGSWHHVVWAFEWHKSIAFWCEFYFVYLPVLQLPVEFSTSTFCFRNKCLIAGTRYLLPPMCLSNMSLLRIPHTHFTKSSSSSSKEKVGQLTNRNNNTQFL